MKFMEKMAKIAQERKLEAIKVFVSKQGEKQRKLFEK
jgi:hypothetical protein